MDEHESSMSFPQKNNYSCKFCFRTFYLGVGADTYLEMKAFFCFTPYRLFNGVYNRQFNWFAIKFSP